jgi:hypothetical protein
LAGPGVLKKGMVLVKLKYSVGPTDGQIDDIKPINREEKGFEPLPEREIA